LVDALSVCPRDIQERMVSHFTQGDAEYGRRVAEGIGLTTGGPSNGNGSRSAAAKVPEAAR
jgi:catalase